MKLYEIETAILSVLDSPDGEIDPMKLDDLEMAFEQKGEGVLRFRQGMLAEAEAIGTEIARLKARADALTRGADWLKSYLHQSMTRLGIGKLSTTTFTASVCKSPPRVELAGEIPAEYRREKVTVDLDKAAVLADHKAGKPLPPGVSVTQGSYLKIS